MPEANDHAGVAIVDDEVCLIRAYELLFKRRQIPIAFTAYDGMEAIEKFKKSNPKPKVVIIDYRLTDMNGLDVMGEILAMEPKTHIIFISGDDSILRESMAAGAVFMKKPTPIKEITDTINALMNDQ